MRDALDASLGPHGLLLIEPPGPRLEYLVVAQNSPSPEFHSLASQLSDPLKPGLGSVPRGWRDRGGFWCASQIVAERLLNAVAQVVHELLGGRVGIGSHMADLGLLHIKYLPVTCLQQPLLQQSLSIKHHLPAADIIYEMVAPQSIYLDNQVQLRNRDININSLFGDVLNVDLHGVLGGAEQHSRRLGDLHLERRLMRSRLHMPDDFPQVLAHVLHRLVLLLVLQAEAHEHIEEPHHKQLAVPVLAQEFIAAGAPVLVQLLHPLRCGQEEPLVELGALLGPAGAGDSASGLKDRLPLGLLELHHRICHLHHKFPLPRRMPREPVRVARALELLHGQVFRSERLTDSVEQRGVHAADAGNGPEQIDQLGGGEGVGWREGAGEGLLGSVTGPVQETVVGNLPHCQKRYQLHELLGHQQTQIPVLVAPGRNRLNGRLGLYANPLVDQTRVDTGKRDDDRGRHTGLGQADGQLGGDGVEQGLAPEEVRSYKRAADLGLGH
mmetsp:Transcript_20689/g.46030  ORF Transcript_20689/g.46030 Transcript_20689/m.46030 type:complete len:496 (+) Transcript_20689:867-2354(+)